MFTGIVTDIGTIERAEDRADRRVTIRATRPLADVAMGASIACSGCCLTVVGLGDDWFAADVSAETIARTAPGLWNAGAALNLERSLRVGDELGGHIVTGHVDGIATVVSVEPEGGSHRVRLSIPRTLGRFLAPKGSVALDGVSLTVNAVADEGELTVFTVNIIPHTWGVTTLAAWTPGKPVNLEIDPLARYLARMNGIM